MQTRSIGIDLAVTATHKAVVLDWTSNRFVSKLLKFRTDPAAIDRVLAAARADAPDDVQLMAILEATGMSWYSVGLYLQRHGVDVYRVNGQQVADLRRVYQRYAKSDRIDARVLARLPLLCPENLHRCPFPSGPQMALQRACREVDRLTDDIAASKNRLLATDQFAWLGLSDITPPYEDAAFWLREQWYDPWHVVEAGEAALADTWRATSPQQPADTSWIPCCKLLCNASSSAFAPQKRTSIPYVSRPYVRSTGSCIRNAISRPCRAWDRTARPSISPSSATSRASLPCATFAAGVG